MRDFRKETIYFIVTDRFMDGDPDNSTGKDPSGYDPTHTDWQMYWGGDLQGIIQKLDYLTRMGASAIWITPVFDQVDGVVIENGVRRAPYHGYWAKDFKRIDEHLVDRSDDVRVFERNDTVFDNLIRALHERGSSLILDVVCNHSSPHMPGGRGELYDDGKKIASYDEDHTGWYHHMGEVTNWSNLVNVQQGDLCGLSDFNEESHGFRTYIKEAIHRWIEKGVDGLRVDTVKHMPLWFWQEFTSDMRREHPNVFMFGEWFLGGVWDPESMEFARLSGMTILDFSLRGALEEALARDVYRGFAQVADVFLRDGSFLTASELVTFVDNHDLPRFLSMRNDADRFRLANIVVMTARGIPCIYYGTEQLLHNDTAGGNDPYNRPMMECWDENAPLYRVLATLSALRKRNIAVQKGGMFFHTVIPDVLVYSRRYMGASVVVAMNKGAPTSLTLSGLPLPDGTYRCLLTNTEVIVTAGEARLSLATHEALVLECGLPRLDAKVVCEFQLNGLATHFGQEVYVVGDCPELGNWDYDRAVKMEWINANTWGVDVPIEQSAGIKIAYKYFIKSTQGLARENLVPRRRRFATEGYCKFRDDWNSFPSGV